MVQVRKRETAVALASAHQSLERQSWSRVFLSSGSDAALVSKSFCFRDVIWSYVFNPFVFIKDLNCWLWQELFRWPLAMPFTATGDSLIIPSIQLTIIRFDPHQAAASQYVFKMTSGFKNHPIHATQSRSLLSANQHNYFEFTSMCLFLVHVMIIPESGFPNRESRCSNMSDPAPLQIELSHKNHFGFLKLKTPGTMSQWDIQQIEDGK